VAWALTRRGTSARSITTAARVTARQAALHEAVCDLFLLAHRALAALEHGAEQAPEAIGRIIDECGGKIPPPVAPLGPLQAHTVAVASALAVVTHTRDKTGDALLGWIVGHDHRLARSEPNIVLRVERH
jgi:hypothetical protein